MYRLPDAKHGEDRLNQSQIIYRISTDFQCNKNHKYFGETNTNRKMLHATKPQKSETARKNVP